MNIQPSSTEEMRRTRYQLGDKIWAVKNAKKKNLTNAKAAEETTEYLQKKYPGFAGKVSKEVFRRWKSLPGLEEGLSHGTRMSLKARYTHTHRSSVFEAVVLEFLKILTDPFKAESGKRVKYKVSVVRQAAIHVRNGVLLVLRKSLLWRDLVGGLPLGGVEKTIDEVEEFRCSVPWCKRLLETLMMGERKNECLSFIDFKSIEVSVEWFEECLEWAVAKAFESMGVDKTAMLSLKNSKIMEGLGTFEELQWGNMVVNLKEELRYIGDNGSIRSSAMHLYCAEMVKRSNEKEGKGTLWVMPPSLLCKLLEIEPSLNRTAIDDILCRMKREARLQLDGQRDAEKLLYPLPRTSNGDILEGCSKWCLVLVDKTRMQTSYFESRCAADSKCLGFRTATEMCILLTHKLNRPEIKRIHKKYLIGYKHFHQQIDDLYLQRIKSFKCSGLFVCKVVEWICTRRYPRTETYQEEVLESGKFIRRVIVEACLGNDEMVNPR